MKLYPRDITLEPGKINYTVTIENTATDSDRLIIFKVRRAEKKVIDFAPKHGVVAPGNRINIKLSVIDWKVSKSRVLVKLGSIKNSLFSPLDFNASWSLATSRTREVKKIINLFNPHSSLFICDVNNARNAIRQQLDNRSTSPYDSNQSIVSNRSIETVPSVAKNVEPSPDLLSESSTFTMPQSQFEDSILASSNFDYSEQGRNMSDEAKAADDSQQQIHKALLQVLSHLPLSQDTSVELFNHLSKVQDNSAQKDRSYNSNFGDDRGISGLLNNSAKETEDTNDGNSYNCLVNHNLKSAGAPYWQKVDDETESDMARVDGCHETADRGIDANEENQINVEFFSRLRLLRAKDNDQLPFVNSSRNCLLEIFGNRTLIDEGIAPEGAFNSEFLSKSFGNEEVLKAAESRISEAINLKQKVIAMEIVETDMTSLEFSIGNIYCNRDRGNTTSREKDASRSELDPKAPEDDLFADKLRTMSSLLFEENLRSLTVNTCPQLMAIDGSINRFNQLTSLNLSGNRIATIDAPLDLPLLKTLDISNNNLSSLDYLQLLTGLTTLIAAHNRISALRHSATMLVSLSKQLCKLDLAGNPVCSHQQYAREIIQVLPRLRYFDGVDLNNLMGTGQGGTYSALLNTSREISNLELNSSLSKEIQPRKKRLPALPVEAKVANKNLISSTGNISTKSLSAVDMKRNFERRLRIALGGRRRISLDNGEDKDFCEHRVYASTEWIGGKLSVMEDEKQLYHVIDDSKNSYSDDKLCGYDNSDEEEVIQNELSGIQDSLRQLHEQQEQNRNPLRGWKHDPPPPIKINDSYDASIPNSANNSTAIRSQSPSTSFMRPTSSTQKRRKSYGINAPDAENEGDNFKNTSASSRGYYSEGDDSRKRKNSIGTSRLNCSYRNMALTVDEATFREMQETERYSIWHPRYRVPQPIFGFSKPFIQRSMPSQKTRAPLFEATVQRIRDGFMKLPTRGTFPRAAKGLTASFYPMDYEDLEAARRQGRFSDTIGMKPDVEYREKTFEERRRKEEAQNHKITTKEGSVIISPMRSGRRVSIGAHESRQYKAPSPVDTSYPDPTSSPSGGSKRNSLRASLRSMSPNAFTGFAKWHPQLFDESEEENTNYNSNLHYNDSLKSTYPTEFSYSTHAVEDMHSKEQSDQYDSFFSSGDRKESNILTHSEETKAIVGEVKDQTIPTVTLSFKNCSGTSNTRTPSPMEIIFNRSDNIPVLKEKGLSPASINASYTTPVIGLTSSNATVDIFSKSSSPKESDTEFVTDDLVSASQSSNNHQSSNLEEQKKKAYYVIDQSGNTVRVENQEVHVQDTPEQIDSATLFAPGEPNENIDNAVKSIDRNGKVQVNHRDNINVTDESTEETAAMESYLSWLENQHQLQSSDKSASCNGDYGADVTALAYSSGEDKDEDIDDSHLYIDTFVDSADMEDGKAQDSDNHGTYRKKTPTIVGSDQDRKMLDTSKLETRDLGRTSSELLLNMQNGKVLAPIPALSDSSLLLPNQAAMRSERQSPTRSHSRNFDNLKSERPGTLQEILSPRDSWNASHSILHTG